MNDKKIGIVTFHRAHNYGAMLQVYALEEVLKKTQNDVEVIDYYNSKLFKGYELINFECNSIPGFLKSTLKTARNILLRTTRYNRFNKFLTKKLNLSKRYNNIEELNNADLKYNAMITGSDQVWNENITEGLSDIYTLNFGKENIKRISYAASIGNANIPDDKKEEYKNKLLAIDKMSVREESAKKELSQILDKEITVTIDPTLLLSKEEWSQKLNLNENKKNEKYILLYMADEDEECIKIANSLSEKTGLKIIHFSYKNGNIKNISRKAYNSGPIEFVELIKNAEYVIVASFHGAVFSIIFNKNFFVVPHRKTGARVKDLLNKLQISDRIMSSLDEFLEVDYNSKIEYNKVEEILKKEKEKSIKWLNEAIND